MGWDDERDLPLWDLLVVERVLQCLWWPWLILQQFRYNCGTGSRHLVFPRYCPNLLPRSLRPCSRRLSFWVWCWGLSFRTSLPTCWRDWGRSWGVGFWDVPRKVWFSWGRWGRTWWHSLRRGDKGVFV